MEEKESRFKEKRKGGESNEVCRKDEKSARRDRDSINKSIGEDEEASR